MDPICERRAIGRWMLFKVGCNATTRQILPRRIKSAVSSHEVELLITRYPYRSMLNEMFKNCNYDEAKELGPTLPAMMAPDDVCFNIQFFLFMNPGE